ncbi:MAG: hypothetical protein GXC73_15500, partial [Chitinophagaceae bacterium]|nr:hypothetical protein [Chitinophagaceae bacterium]
MKKIVLLIAVILTAAICFAFVYQSTNVKKNVSITIWYYIGSNDQEIINPDFYSQTGIETNCGSIGNVPCVIEVPHGITPGGAQEDLEAFLEQFVYNP